MIELRSDQVVRYVHHMGDDKEIVEDAQTSLAVLGKSHRTPTDRTLSPRTTGVMNTLVRGGHVSTLRGCILKVEIETTISMQRQMRTHWVGMRQLWPDVNLDFDENDWMGFNDQSGKYAYYRPVFWVPDRQQCRIEEPGFKPMHPTYRPATDEEYVIYREQARRSYEQAWDAYCTLKELGYSREMIRNHIPGGIYVAGVITANLNAWLGFISKRIDHPENTLETKPQLEIQQLAEQIETLVATYWPQLHSIWAEGGRPRL